MFINDKAKPLLISVLVSNDALTWPIIAEI
jgi:hypothetical protein